MRVVSLLPSATEIVCALGLTDELVAVSHSCDYPAGVRALPRVTSTHVPYDQSSRAIDDFVRGHLGSHAALYDLDMEALEAAAPDVIVSQALCDVCAVSTGDVIAALEGLSSKPLLVDLEPNTLDDVLNDCERVGDALGVTAAGAELTRSLQQRREQVAARTSRISDSSRPRVAFLEWLVPPFNGGHWNPELVALAGGTDLLGSPGLPSSTLSWDTIVEQQPELIFVACCGFSTGRAIEDIRSLSSAQEWQSLPAVRNGNVFVTDGNAYFSRPGPRLLDGLEMMAHAFHPDIHPPSQHGSCQRSPAI